MDALGRSSRISRKERIRNVTIRQQIGLEETIVKEIEQNQLTWHGHFQIMAEERLPKIALKWIPKEGCPRRNVPDFGRVFLMLKYTDITQNTYVQS